MRINGILGSDGPFIRRSAKSRSWEKAEDFKRKLEEEYEAKQEGLEEASGPKPTLVTVKEAVSRFLNSKRNVGRLVKRGEKGIFILAPMVGRRSAKDVATDEPNQDATTEGQQTLYGFRAVYVFDRLSRDLWPTSARPMDAARAPIQRLPSIASKHIIAQLL